MKWKIWGFYPKGGRGSFQKPNFIIPLIWDTAFLPNITFTKYLPNIYQPFTKDLPKIRPYLAFYLLKFTKVLPKTYKRFTKSTKHLPKAIKYFFNLPKTYQQFTKNVWPKIFWYFYSVFSKKYLATVFIKTWSANWL